MSPIYNAGAGISQRLNAIQAGIWRLMHSEKGGTEGDEGPDIRPLDAGITSAAYDQPAFNTGH